LFSNVFSSIKLIIPQIKKDKQQPQGTPGDILFKDVLGKEGVPEKKPEKGVP